MSLLQLLMIENNEKCQVSPIRLAIVVSHPIQYYVPVYRILAARPDVELRVFYTWHGGDQQHWDSGFEQNVAWDIPLTAGYDSEVVPNVASNPGTTHFFGLRNPRLLETVMAWKPDVVHLTGYAYASHLRLLRALPRNGVPVLFRGDSHLLGPRPWWKRLVRTAALKQIFRGPSGFLYVGQHNRDYFRACGVPESKLFYCPHSVEFERFAEPEDRLEAEARQWRRSLEIRDDQVVLLFAGKFQPKKQPTELMQAVLRINNPRLVLVLVGDGPQMDAVRELATSASERFRVLPFQNQSRMPLVYRLGDVFVLPSYSADETWGLAVNEAMACRRPVLVSDLVGCAPDLVTSGMTGEVFRAGDWTEFGQVLMSLLARGADGLRRLGIAAHAVSGRFTAQATADRLIFAANSVFADTMGVHANPTVIGECSASP